VTLFENRLEHLNLHFTLPKLIAWLLENHCQLVVNIESKPDKKTALMMATKRGYLSTFSLLRGTSSLSPPPQFPWSPTPPIGAGALLHNGGDGTLIHRCVKLAKMNRWECIPSVKPPPKFIEWRQQKLEILKLLLAEGVDPSLTTSTGLSPLHAACWGGFKAAVKLLLEDNRGRILFALIEIESNVPTRF